MPGLISMVAIAAAMVPSQAGPPGNAVPVSISRSARMIAERTPLLRISPSPLNASQKKSRDSLTNGAVTGAVVGGGAMLLFASRTCRETSCAPDALLFTGFAAGLGAAAGAGIDALFSR